MSNPLLGDKNQEVAMLKLRPIIFMFVLTICPATLGRDMQPAIHIDGFTRAHHSPAAGFCALFPMIRLQSQTPLLSAEEFRQEVYSSALSWLLNQPFVCILRHHCHHHQREVPKVDKKINRRRTQLMIISSCTHSYL
jgi:hypothetical protein